MSWLIHRNTRSVCVDPRRDAIESEVPASQVQPSERRKRRVTMSRGRRTLAHSSLVINNQLSDTRKLHLLEESSYRNCRLKMTRHNVVLPSTARAKAMRR